MISEFIKSTKIIASDIRKIKIVLLVESVLLVVIGITSPVTGDLVTTCTISLLAAIQVSIFGKLEGSRIATTMITGNLKSAMENLHAFLADKDKASGKKFIRYIIVIASFGLGASIGAWLTNLFRDNSIYFCLVLVVIAYWLVSVEGREMC